MARLMGSITLNKRLREHPIWQGEPFSRGQAWTDLLLLANDSPRVVKIHGEEIALLRGQLAWSQRNLALAWHRGDEWVRKVLSEFQELAMILVKPTKRLTVITILNYDVYNTVRSGTEPDSDTVTDSGTEPDSEPAQKGEQGRGNGNQESGNPPPDDDFAEIPSRAEVLAFALAYTGDLVRGIPAVIPEAWAVSWFEWRSGDGSWPKKWRADFTRRFEDDFVKRHPKAVGVVVPSKKNAAAVQTDGRSPAQRRFEVSRELEEVKVRLDAAHDTGIPPNAKDRAREKVLKAALKELEATK